MRIPLAADARPARPLVGQLVATFDPFDPVSGRSADLTDLAFDERGRLYVVSAQPARIYRFTPDPSRVFDGREGRAAPWLNLAAAAGRPTLKSENILWHDGWLYVTSGDGYADAGGATGTIFRVRADD
ncbi:MAG: hypothetical protein ACYTGG_09235 [Planctomycetota bacterium]